MKIELSATFRFFFRGNASKKESQNRLKTFLHANKWLPIDLDYDTEVLDYHTEANGICEVTLKKIAGTSIEELADIFFVDLRNTEDIKWVTILYNEHTDKLFHNYAGRYLNRQTVQLSEIKENDEVIILYK